MNEKVVTYDWGIFRDKNHEFDHDMWKMSHPTSHFKDYTSKGLDVAFYIITGKKDEIVPFAEVEKFEKELSEVAKVTSSYEEEGIHAWKFWEVATKKALEEFNK